MIYLGGQAKKGDLSGGCAKEARLGGKPSKNQTCLGDLLSEGGVGLVKTRGDLLSEGGGKPSKKTDLSGGSIV